MENQTLKLGLAGYFVVAGKIQLDSGLHIGAAQDSVEIGGIDNPVVRHPITEMPYVPGSSIKGRMRSILAKQMAAKDPSFTFNRSMQGGRDIYHHVTDDIEDYVKNGKTQKGALNDAVCRLFGSTGGGEIKSTSTNKNIDGRNYPGRLLVRDAHVSIEDEDLLKKDQLLVTEAKMENAIDRVTSAASPRTTERVPAGALFTFQLVYRAEAVYPLNGGDDKPSLPERDRERFKEDIANIMDTMRVIQDHEGLGGSTSRGYGWVSFYISQAYFDPLSNEKNYIIGNENTRPGILKGLDVSFFRPLVKQKTNDLVAKLSFN